MGTKIVLASYAILSMMWIVIGIINVDSIGGQNWSHLQFFPVMCLTIAVSWLSSYIFRYESKLAAFTHVCWLNWWIKVLYILSFGKIVLLAATMTAYTMDADVNQQHFDKFMGK